MRVKYAVFRRQWPTYVEWLVVTLNSNVFKYTWYDVLPMTDNSVYDHFEIHRLANLPRAYERVKDQGVWPLYVHYWLARELGCTQSQAQAMQIAEEERRARVARGDE